VLQPLADHEVVAMFLNNLGYEAMKHGVDAGPYFRAATRIAPGLAGPWNNLAVYLKQHDRVEEARDVLLDAVSSRVRSFAPYFNLGKICLDDGDPVHAAAWLRKAWFRGWRNPFVVYNLGLAYSRQGKRLVALTLLRRAWRMDSSLVAAHTKIERLEAVTRGKPWSLRRSPP